MSEEGGVLRAAGEVQKKLSAANFDFCMIGGIALQRWGEPRYTQDVDLTLLCPYGEERATARRLSEIVSPRVEDAVAFSRESRVYLGQTDTGVPVDIAFGAIAFEMRCVERSSSFQIKGDLILRTCSAEDLIVMKAFANRDRDWADIAGIVTRSGHVLNWDQILTELRSLVEVRGGTEILERLSRYRDGRR